MASGAAAAQQLLKARTPEKAPGEVRFCRWCFKRLRAHNTLGNCREHRLWLGVPIELRFCGTCGLTLRCDNTTGLCQRHKFKDSENLNRVRAAQKTKRARNQAFVDAIKLTAGCVDCGYSEHACALDFDHIPERGAKAFSISSRMSLVITARLVAEIEKCEVVCSNCHRVRTFKRGQHVRRLWIVVARTVQGQPRRSRLPRARTKL